VPEADGVRHLRLDRIKSLRAPGTYQPIYNPGDVVSDPAKTATSLKRGSKISGARSRGVKKGKSVGKASYNWGLPLSDPAKRRGGKLTGSGSRGPRMYVYRGK
jgi:hypothetical protein